MTGCIPFVAKIHRLIKEEPALGEKLADEFVEEVKKEWERIAVETAEKYCKFFVNPEPFIEEMKNKMME